MTVKQLLEAGKINLDYYETYEMYTTQLGERYLKARLLDAVMLPAPVKTGVGFAWIDGQRCVWRDIVIIIETVNKLLEDANDNGSRKQRKRES